MAGSSNFSNANVISQAATKIVALIALCIIMWIDASSDLDAKDVELILAGFVAGAEVLSTYKKIKK